MKLIVLKNNVPLHEVSVDTTAFEEMYEIYVGRSEDCHVQIDDPLISRHHCVLKNEHSLWFCEKLSQLGVVTLNGTLVTKNPVTNGDEIKCGIYSIIVTGLSQGHKKVETPAYSESAHVFTTQVIEPPPELKKPSPVIIAPGVEDLEPVQELSVEDELNDFQGENLDSFEQTFDIPVSDNLTDDLEPPREDKVELSEDQVVDGDSNFLRDLDNSNDDSYEVSTNESNESTRFFKTFVNYQLVLFGEHAPYDRFSIDQNEIFIGRDTKKCQIILNDREVSSVHAVIRKNMVEITIEDLGSSNGTILNAERINKAILVTGDEFVIGGTSFTLEIKSDLLDSEANRLMPVEAGQTIETEEIEEEEVTSTHDGDISFDSDAPPEKSLIKRLQKDPKFRKKAIYALAGLVFLYVIMDPQEPETEPQKKVVKETKVKDKNAKPQLVLSKELEEARNVAYEQGVSFYDAVPPRFDRAEQEFQKVVSIDPNYKNIQTYLEQTRASLAHLAELEAQKKIEEERIKIKKLVDDLLVKAREAVKERQVPVAESYFSQIVEKDPENIEVTQLKLELESWQREEERKALEKATREAARKKMVDSLSFGKTFYLKKEWYKSILKLEEFLRLKGIDEDLIKEASEMLSDAKNQLASDLGPLLGKARSFKEGQDFKNAYEAFLEVLKIEPTNAESLNEVDDIKAQLDGRSKRIYREAIIAESLSLFADAKEKFQEVQQISPTDSEYYKKASEKLKNYLE